MNIVNTYALDLNAAPINGERPLLLAVLTRGEVDDYAVYESIVPASTPRDKAAAWVARHGTKCNLKRARTYYPDLPEDTYRA